MNSPATLPTQNSIKKFLKGLSKSRFFTISILLHVLAILIFGGTVLFNVYVEPGDFEGEPGGNFVQGDASVRTPQALPPIPTTPTQTITAPTQTSTSLQAITTMSQSTTNFVLPTLAPAIAPTAKDLATSAPTPVSPGASQGMTREIAQGIAGFSQGWSKGQGTGSGTGIRKREFQFTAYLAKYTGGNWNSTVRTSGAEPNQKITFGSLPNLLYVMQFWSRDKIKATPDPVPLRLDSDQIFSIKPPFIFFTGTRDFKLSDKEIENLRKYLRLGGALWGDSTVPGRRSRFDIAFRREMKRVVGDVDKDWELIPPDHAIYDQRRVYFPEIRTTPPGINYYQEPVYALKVFGEIAILYTANDYGDMWQFGLNKDGKFDTRKDVNGNYVAMNQSLYDLRNTYIRNISEDSVVNTYKFGVNVILHLITRWEDKVRSVPKL